MVTMDVEDDCLAKVRQVLCIRDLRGRLPLHCAAHCPWVDERMIRTLVNIYPEACYRQQAAQSRQQIVRVTRIMVFGPM